MPVLNDLLGGLPPLVVYAVVGVLVAAESAIVAGLILPAATALIALGLLANAGTVRIVPALVVAVAAALVGGTAAFHSGRRRGPRLRSTRLGRWIGEKRWERAERLFNRHGGRAIFLGQWIVGARTLIPRLAGMNGVGYRRFALWHTPAAALWAMWMVGASYLAGASYNLLVARAGRAGGAVAVLAVLIIVLVLAGRWLGQHPRPFHRLATSRAALPILAVGRRLGPTRLLGRAPEAGRRHQPIRTLDQTRTEGQQPPAARVLDQAQAEGQQPPATPILGQAQTESQQPPAARVLGQAQTESQQPPARGLGWATTTARRPSADRGVDRAWTVGRRLGMGRVLDQARAAGRRLENGSVWGSGRRLDGMIGRIAARRRESGALVELGLSVVVLLGLAALLVMVVPVVVRFSGLADADVAITNWAHGQWTSDGYSFALHAATIADPSELFALAAVVSVGRWWLRRRRGGSEGLLTAIGPVLPIVVLAAVLSWAAAPDWETWRAPSSVVFPSVGEFDGDIPFYAVKVMASTAAGHTAQLAAAVGLLVSILTARLAWKWRVAVWTAAAIYVTVSAGAWVYLGWSRTSETVAAVLVGAAWAALNGAIWSAPAAAAAGTGGGALLKSGRRRAIVSPIPGETRPREWEGARYDRHEPRAAATRATAPTTT